MEQPTTAILHYTAPPIIGGVEAVIQAHAQTFIQLHYPVTVITGRGEAQALPPDTDFTLIPEMSSRHPQIAQMSASLEQGQIPDGFDAMVDQLEKTLAPVLRRFENVIVHNIFTKHFNLPLTAALYRLLDNGDIHHGIAWCHDFTWTSPHSRSKVHPGYPWDLLRTQHPDVTYVVVSQRRQRALAELFDCPSEQIQVVYNGVDPQTLLGLSCAGYRLINRLGLLESDLILLMPVRVTQAKNIEYALQVVAALKARGSHPKLIVTGPPDPHDADNMAYFESLQALREKLDVEAEMRFVFESGPDPGEPFTIDAGIVGELFRVSDLTFMPSHREGFGMPVLEAGLVGQPVFCTNIPAAEEIGASDVTVFEAGLAPEKMAAQIDAWAQASPEHRMRRRMRKSYTWQAIFEQAIRPLLKKRSPDHVAST